MHFGDGLAPRFFLVKILVGLRQQFLYALAFPVVHRRAYTSRNRWLLQISRYSSSAIRISDSRIKGGLDRCKR